MAAKTVAEAERPTKRHLCPFAKSRRGLERRNERRFSRDVQAVTEIPELPTVEIDWGIPFNSRWFLD